MFLYEEVVLFCKNKKWNYSYKITIIINICNKLCEIPFYINNIIVVTDDNGEYFKYKKYQYIFFFFFFFPGGG